MGGKVYFYARVWHQHSQGLSPRSSSRSSSWSSSRSSSRSSKVAVEQRGKPSGLVNFQSYKTIFIVFPLWECFWIYIFSKIWRINTLDMVKLSMHFISILSDLHAYFFNFTPPPSFYAHKNHWSKSTLELQDTVVLYQIFKFLVRIWGICQ